MTFGHTSHTHTFCLWGKCPSCQSLFSVLNTALSTMYRFVWKWSACDSPLGEIPALSCLFCHLPRALRVPDGLAHPEHSRFLHSSEPLLLLPSPVSALFFKIQLRCQLLLHLSPWTFLCHLYHQSVLSVPSFTVLRTPCSTVECRLLEQTPICASLFSPAVPWTK